MCVTGEDSLLRLREMGAMLESGPTTTNVREKNDQWHVANAPRTSGAVSVELTRTELVALRETIELTPLFSGRDELRNAIVKLLTGHRSRPLPLCVEEQPRRLGAKDRARRRSDSNAPVQARPCMPAQRPRSSSRT